MGQLVGGDDAADCGPLPTAALVHQLIMALVGRGYGDEDFMRLLTMEAESSGMEIVSENAPVGDGLS